MTFTPPYQQKFIETMFADFFSNSVQTMLLSFQGSHHSKKENEDNAPVGHASLYSISEELGNLVALSRYINIS